SRRCRQHRSRSSCTPGSAPSSALSPASPPRPPQPARSTAALRLSLSKGAWIPPTATGPNSLVQAIFVAVGGLVRQRHSSPFKIRRYGELPQLLRLHPNAISGSASLGSHKEKRRHRW